MAKKQTRRSISVSRVTYERLKAFCETNNISMSQFVETRVGDFLTDGTPVTVTPTAPREHVATPAPVKPAAPVAAKPLAAPVAKPAPVASVAPATPAPATMTTAPAPMTSAAARFAIEPPPPIIKPRQDTSAPKPAEKRPDQIFTF